MQYVVNTHLTYKISQCIEGNFFEPGSKIILTENTIYLFCKENKLIKIKHFYCSIIQIEKIENKKKDFLVILFTENRLSYLFYDLEVNDFKVEKIKYFNCDCRNPLIRISKEDVIIKLNKYEFSYLNNGNIILFTTLHRDLVNIVDILMISDNIPVLVVLTQFKCFTFCNVLLNEFEFDEPCIKLIKIGSFFCVIGKYSIFFIKNGISYKISSNIFKVEYLDEEIIDRIKLSNHMSYNKLPENKKLLLNDTFLKDTEETLLKEENKIFLEKKNSDNKILENKKNNLFLEDQINEDENSFLENFENEKTETKNKNWEKISEIIIYNAKEKFFVDADFSNSYFATKDNKLFILYNNLLTILEINSNNLIILDYKICKYLAPTTNIDFFCVNNSQIILNNCIFDLNFKFVNFYFEELKINDIEEKTFILEYKSEDLIYRFTKNTFSLYKITNTINLADEISNSTIKNDSEEIKSCSFYSRKIIFEEFLFILCKDLVIKNAYTFETIKKIKDVDNFDVKELLCVIKNGFVFFFNNFKLVCSAFLNDFSQSLLINFSEDTFLFEEVKKNNSTNLFENLISDCNFFKEKSFIKELIFNEDYFLIRNLNDVVILYRKIENYFVKVTVNNVSILDEDCFYEDKEKIVIKGNPNLVLNKSTFFISKINCKEDFSNSGSFISNSIKRNDLIFKKDNQDISDRKVEKDIFLSTGKIQIETENSIFYKERFENDSDDEDCIDVGAITKKFFISFYNNSYFINEYELLADEFITNIKEMTLNDLQSKNNKSNFLIVSTTFVKSEESFFRGRILLFEIINVVPQENKSWTSKKMKILAIEKAKAPVLDICEVRGLIACCIGTKLLIYELDRNDGLNCIAFHDTNVLAVKIESIKNYILIGDLKGILFFYFQTKPAKIHLLGSELIATKEIQLYTYKTQLFFITLDLYDVVRIFTYSPYNYLSKDGLYLIKRLQFNYLYNFSIKIVEDLHFYERVALEVENTGGFNFKEMLCTQKEGLTLQSPQFSFLFYEFLNFDISKQKKIVENVKKAVHKLGELLN